MTRVAALWRYPVKSCAGETVARVRVDRRGLEHDRRWAVLDHDGKLGSGKSSRRFRRMNGLLDLSASLRDGGPLIRFPDGDEFDASDPGVHRALSDHVGRTVTLAEEDGVPHHDDAPVHLVLTRELGDLAEATGRDEVDPRRFRPNIVVETGDLGDSMLLGRTITVGDVVLRVTHPTERCVMVTMAQDGLPGDGTVLRDVATHRDLCFGVYADVLHPGEITLGDTVQW